VAERTQLAVVKALGKECTKCCVWKPLSEFYKGGGPGGKHSRREESEVGQKAVGP
jgi:hypothetical protein